jgi:translation initiation factor 6 (eIF-6)
MLPEAAVALPVIEVIIGERVSIGSFVCPLLSFGGLVVPMNIKAYAEEIRRIDTRMNIAILREVFIAIVYCVVRIYKFNDC